MDETARDAGVLRGKRVAFTGRLASMTRTEAAELVRTYRGTFVASVNRRTSYLIVGQEGWPLRKDGRLTHKLLKARILQRRGYPLHVLSEEELLARLDLDKRSEAIRRLYTAAELGKLLNVSRGRLRRWLADGLVKPAETHDGICYFDFRQVSAVKSLCKLAQAGVRPERIRRSLHQLSRAMPGLSASLFQHGEELLVRSEEGHLVDPTGQLVFDFEEEPKARTVQVEPRSRPPELWFEEGCTHEEAGRLREAERAYRQALRAGARDPDISFNLANVLYALGDNEAASGQYRQALETNPSFAEAWNNLGNALAQLGVPEEAAAAYKQALQLNPNFADAHYNLADLLDEQGKLREARAHWQTYLRLERHGAWARYAQARLAGKREA